MPSALPATVLAEAWRRVGEMTLTLGFWLLLGCVIALANCAVNALDRRKR